MATLKSYPAVYTQSAYETSDVKDLVFRVWSWDQRAAIVNIFEIAGIPEAFAKARTRLGISEEDP